MDASLRPRECLQDRFIVDELISETQLSRLYRARDRRTGEDVAIKVLDVQGCGEAERLQMEGRFEREIRVYTRLRHPHLVRFISQGMLESGSPYVVLEYVHGRSLYEVLQDEGPLTPREALRVMAQCLSALSHAHAKGIVHRDLKPENIMLRGEAPKRDAVLIDYGLAGIRNWRSILGIERRLSFAGQVPGTPQYIAPERLSGAITAASDIYTWALVFVEALTGKPLVDGRKTIEVLRKHVEGDFSLPRLLVDTSLGALLMSALSREPRARPDARKLLKALLPGFRGR